MIPEQKETKLEKLIDEFIEIGCIDHIRAKELGINDLYTMISVIKSDGAEIRSEYVDTPKRKKDFKRYFIVSLDNYKKGSAGKYERKEIKRIYGEGNARRKLKYPAYK